MSFGDFLDWSASTGLLYGAGSAVENALLWVVVLGSALGVHAAVDATFVFAAVGGCELLEHEIKITNKPAVIT